MPGRQLSKKDGDVGSQDGGRPGKTEAREAKIAAVLERRLSGRRDEGRGREKRRRRRKNAGVHALAGFGDETPRGFGDFGAVPGQQDGLFEN
jgi:hypothetical protein